MQGVTYGNRVYGLPFGAGAQFAYVNLNRFAETGVPAPKKGWTMDTLEAIVPKLSRYDATGKLNQWGLAMNGGYLSGWAPFFLADGGDFLDVNGRFALQREPVPSRMDWIVKMVSAGTGASWDWNKIWEAGDVAVKVDWEGRVPLHLTQKMPFEWFLTDMPVGRAGNMALYNSHFIGINKNTAHPNEAWRFVRFFYEKGDALFGQNFLYPVTLNGAKSLLTKGSAILPAGYDVWSFYGPVLDPPGKAIIYPAHIPGWMPEVEKIVTAASVEVQRGTKPARTAMEAIAAQVDAILAGARADTIMK